MALARCRSRCQHLHRYRENAAGHGEDREERRRLFGVGLMLGTVTVRSGPVGWAKRSVPTIFICGRLVGTLTLCPPYEATQSFVPAAPFPAASPRPHRPALPA